MNVQELKKAVGMLNYYSGRGKYVSNLATVGQALYELLKSAWFSIAGNLYAN